MHLAIETQNLTVVYGTTAALVDITLACEKEKIIGIIGPRGAGKTTFFKVLLGLVEPQFGSVRIDGVDREHHNSDLGYMPTYHSVDFNFPTTVMEFVLLGRCRKTPWFLSLTSIDKDCAMDALEVVGLVDVRNQQIREMSCEQQQRLLLGRAIAQEGEILLLDDPFIAGEQEANRALVKIFKSLQEMGKTILIASTLSMSEEGVFDTTVSLQTTVLEGEFTQDVTGSKGSMHRHSEAFSVQVRESEGEPS